MTNPKHTPGPWFNDNGNIRAIHDTQLIAEMVFCPQATVQDANTNLVVAAPEMLEALEHLSNELYDGEFVKHSADAIRKIKSAISKARGES